MKRYGKTLMHHVPDGTTLLLKGLCTDYQPSRDAMERDSLDRGPAVAKKVSRLTLTGDLTSQAAEHISPSVTSLAALVLWT